MARPWVGDLQKTVECFKVPEPIPPGFTLRRMSWLQRTVRYEWRGEGDVLKFSPTFVATSQEWERALD